MSDWTERERSSLIDFLDAVSDDPGVDTVDIMADEILTSEWLRKHDAEVLRSAARLIYNGAPDPCQALYNEGANPWLEQLALEREHGGPLE